MTIADASAHQESSPTPSVAYSPPVARCRNVTSRTTSTCSLPASIDDGSSDPDGDLVGCTQSPAGPYAAGNTAVTLTCTDQGGRSTTCTGTVTVTDGVIPVVRVSPTSQTVQCVRGGTYSYLNGVTADDLCAGPLPSANIAWSGTVNMGQVSAHPVTYQARDASNNLSTPVTRTVTVVDTLPPLLSMLGAATMPAECGLAFNDPGAMATDTCIGPMTSSIVRTGSVNTAVIGSYMLRYDVSDGYNSAAQRTRTVIVADTRKPTVTLTGPLSHTVECGAPYADPGATATDLCAGNLPVVATNPPNVGQPGSYTLQYRATDPSGNTATAAQNRVVTVADTLPPTVTLNGPASMAVECASPFQDPGATASDQCSGAVSVTSSGWGNSQVPGVQTITYSATDRAGHTASTTRRVTVSDTLPPVLTLLGPATQSLECDGEPYVEPGATASDYCSGDLTPNIIVSSNLDQSQEGEYTVTYSVEDAAGNVSTAVRQLTVGPCVRCLPVHLSEFNLFLLESYTGGHDVEGKVAAGGDITLTDFAVGARVPDGNIAHTLVAGRNLSLSRGGVWGDAWHGGTYSADASVVYPRGSVAQGTPIDFGARFAELRQLSAQLGGLAATGATRLEPWGGIFLRGTDPSVNVFDMDASTFTGAALWSIDAPAGSLVVVNIRGASATFTGFGTFFSGGIDQHGVLYNFVDATRINAHGFGFWGTVLAPQAHLTFNNGSWDGGIYARSLTGNAEGHVNPLNDREICP
ncbi:immunoglobulin-like domain-containing protein [Hyalangium sp.]|uniref:immunoglobulin-like domain-containing protein n=1 Tax=Hyalangium sp. TaxID=2028555 RepID=UPI002D2CEAE6|nr:immunoglobulin-like domain-containing protein [Hyalangium sp.]HYI03220.1 immunoglobulin-like domain-containing protein [Hyalangium sp.]